MPPVYTIFQSRAPMPSANWTAQNPTLAQFEEGVESDTGKVKRGPGAWNDLGYFNPSGITGGGTITVADEAARLALTDIVNGQIVFQTSGQSFWGLKNEEDISDPDNWTNLAGIENGTDVEIGTGANKLIIGGAYAEITGAFRPPSGADMDMPNATLYYSTDAGKLVFKDGGGGVHDLY